MKMAMVRFCLAWILFSLGVIPDWQKAIMYTEEKSKSHKANWLVKNNYRRSGLLLESYAAC
jgi:hypothetical protein